jgi:shikimate dehydrogenase
MQPELTPLLAAAQASGCRIHYGRSMLDCQIEMMASFMGVITEPVPASVD